MKNLTPDDVVETQIDEAIAARKNTHYIGFHGEGCNVYLGPHIPKQGALTWDSVTCPDCLVLKPANAPWTIKIDTRGD